MIRNIIFDLAEVFINGVLYLARELSPLLGIEEEEIDRMFKGDDFWDYMNGRISENTYLRNVIRDNRLIISLEDLKRIIRKGFTELPGVRRIIEGLSDYNLGLLSVHGMEWIEYLQKYDYHRLFDTVMYSYQTGVSKPDPRAWELILKKMDAVPEETLFIDDSKNNVEAARKLGMTAIRFIDAKQLVEDLDALGIHPRNLNVP